MRQSPASSFLRLGTRGSRLAMAQAASVKDALQQRCGRACELVPIKTSGDRIQDRSLAEIGGKGLFAKELEEAMLAGRIDLAVHSMKDLPTILPEGLAIAATPPREDPSDVFISSRAPSLANLPRGARIGTSSVRRAAQIARLRPDCAIVSLRGNVDTRLAKLDDGAVDAIILALAGLRRLGLEARATAIMPSQGWLPALAQGAIAVEMREDDPTAAIVTAALDDEPTAVAVTCERAFQAALDGSCRTPIAGLATVENGWLFFRGEVLAPDGSTSAGTRFDVDLGAAPRARAAQLGMEAGLSLKERARAWLSF
jgi:hydroxymethylbilane synthase